MILGRELLLCMLAAGGVAGCSFSSEGMDAATPVSATYTAPEASGLVAVRPYPTVNDVCQVIGESEATANFLDHTATLIGCPVHEVGAIADRMAEGAVKVGQVGSWVLLSIPDETADDKLS
ncbi:MAG: hypothetical protein V3U96_13405 [Paracoccaceae bacterium]